MPVANIKEVLQKLLPIFPFMAMSGVINNYFLSLCMILPLLIEFGEWAHEKLYATPSSAHKITIYEKNYWKHRNDIYEIITFIIMRNKLIQNGQNFEIREYYQSKENFVMVGKHNPSKIFLSFPILTLSKGFSTPFAEKDFAVRITTEAMTVKEGEEENKAYVVTANTSQDIQKFLKYVETIQEDYLKEKYGKHLEDVSLLQYRKEKWVESPIAVKKTFENTFLDPSIEASLIQQLGNFVAKRKSYLARGNAYKIGYLFYGLPGNGKSSTIFAIANRYNRNIYKLNLSKVASDEFDTQIHEIQPNSVVIIEDVDTISITNKRDEEKPKEDDFVSLLSSNKQTDLGKLLAVLDGYCDLDGCIVIMTTNHPEKLDPALIRPGRIDHKIEFKNASADQIRRIYKFYFGEELTDDFDVDISVADFINTIVLPNEHDRELCSRSLLMLSTSGASHSSPVG